MSSPQRAPHIPVMANEALRWLNIRPDGLYVDGTAGAGGHAARIAERLETGKLIALDRDKTAVAIAGERLKPFPQACVVHANYCELNQVLHDAGLGRVDGVLIDAGLSSMQIDRPERGFSFQEDGPLDMRMDPGGGPSAAEWLAAVTEDTLAAALRDFGDVAPARRVARAILDRQRAGRMTRTTDLADAVRQALDFVRGDPAEVRTVFQAVRIAVNQELECLRRGLEAAVEALRPGGRLVVISFHSGEDRVVKDTLRQWSRTARELTRDGRVRAVRAPRLRLLAPGPILPSEEETRANPRAKSAKMRVAERLDDHTAED